MRRGGGDALAAASGDDEMVDAWIGKSHAASKSTASVEVLMYPKYDVTARSTDDLDVELCFALEGPNHAELMA